VEKKLICFANLDAMIIDGIIMRNTENKPQEKRYVSPEQVMKKVEPGMSIFVGTGVGEPRTLVKYLMTSDATNLKDLELIQLVSLGDAISLEALDSNRYRLKTFFSGWVASEAITAGRVDLIPSRFSSIPGLITSGQISIDAVFVQITPPNEAGYCSFGVAMDVARLAMEKASLVVGEINSKVPQTLGDTFIHITDFDFLVQSEEEPIYFSRWPVDDNFDQVAANVASVIEDGSCIAFSIGPLYDALTRHLIHKRHLGVHTPFFTDALMDLVKSGAVTNRNKEIFRGKSLTSYAFGTPALMAWLDRNPMIEFQGLDKVFDPAQIGRNPQFVGLLPARKVDITGRIVLHVGKGNVTAGPGDVMDILHGAEISAGGYSIFALPSRNRKGESNIRISVEKFPNQLNIRESVDMIVTEYGAACLNGRSVRERAQALIDIAHPDDRSRLIEHAKADKILYPDQIFLEQSARLYPSEIETKHTFKNNTEIRFRAIKPSDEEEMRRLFYRFSDEAVYYRYFSPIKTMPHAKMQKYVNVDFSQTMSIVGLVGESGQGHIIAEARFVKNLRRPYADVAFVVDEAFQGLGIATYMYEMLIRLAKKQGLQGFTADVLSTNKGMMKVFEKADLRLQAKLEHGIYNLEIPFYPDSQRMEAD
jgi:acyl-CoA hydrolase